MAMLALAHGWARVMGIRLRVVTVNHGLRAGSAEEAAMVARECATLGHPHDTLRWTWDGTGNLQDAARQGRQDVIGAWRGDLRHVLFAHTQDDQAETVLMRLLRGSGVEGLAGMAEARQVPAGWTIVRPLLAETRADLRHYIDTLKLPYVDDPSNADPRFERVRLRQAMATLGLEAAGLARTGHRMARAATALAARAQEVADRIMEQAKEHGAPTGDLLIDRDGLAAVERDTQMRLLAGALQWVASAAYRPRAQALEAMLDGLLSGRGGTLHGVDVTVAAAQIRLSREFAAVAGVTLPATPGAIWDSRWRVGGPTATCQMIRALGPEGWAQRPENKRFATPARAAYAWPAVFQGERLVACPALGVGPAGAITFSADSGHFAPSMD
jgi:tRNA(Ile)-lysidine synthase